MEGEPPPYIIEEYDEGSWFCGKLEKEDISPWLNDDGKALNGYEDEAEDEEEDEDDVNKGAIPLSLIFWPATPLGK